MPSAEIRTCAFLLNDIHRRSRSSCRAEDETAANSGVDAIVARICWKLCGSCCRVTGLCLGHLVCPCKQPNRPYNHPGDAESDCEDVQRRRDWVKSAVALLRFDAACAYCGIDACATARTRPALLESYSSLHALYVYADCADHVDRTETVMRQQWLPTHCHSDVLPECKSTRNSIDRKTL